MAAGSVSTSLQVMRVGFIGCDDLGQEILKGIRWNSTLPSQNPNPWAKARYLANVEKDKASELEKLFATNSDANGYISLQVVQNQHVQVARTCHMVILASPPDSVETILSAQGMREALNGKVMVSLATGVTISQMAAALYPDAEDKGKCSLFRAAPNVAASVGMSATIIGISKDLTPRGEARRMVESFFRYLGTATFVPESQVDGASVVCSGTPALMAFFCEAIVDGAVTGGLPRVLAETMTVQAMAGATALLTGRGGKKKPSELREDMCANPGMTSRVVLDLEKGGVRGSISGAVRDAISALRYWKMDSWMR